MTAPPTGIDTGAPVVARHDVDVAAPLDVVWALHAGVGAWPTWQPDITAATLDGAFAPGASFTWHTAELTITSHVYQVDGAGDLERHTLWGGPAGGIDGVHRWVFTAAPGGTQVHTEESWSGPPVAADVPAMQAALDASLVSWLGHLKAAAERRATG